MIINIKSRKVVVLLFCTIILLCVSFDAKFTTAFPVKNQLQEKSPVRPICQTKKASAPSAPVMLGGEKLFFVPWRHDYHRRKKGTGYLGQNQ